MASMDAIDVLQQQLIAAAHNDLLAPMASDEIDAYDIKKCSSRVMQRSFQGKHLRSSSKFVWLGGLIAMKLT